MAVLMPSIRELSERQYQLFFLFHNVIAQTAPEGLARVTDLDVAQAAASLAGTLETAARGIIYEQPPQSPTARKLAEAFKTLMEQVREQGATLFDREAAITLRAIERGAATVGRDQDQDGGDTAYIDLMARLLQVRRTKPESGQQGFPNHPAVACSFAGRRRRPCYNSWFARSGAKPPGPYQEEKEAMAKRCEICDKGPVVGRTVSHAHNVGPRRFEPNLQTVRALVNGASTPDPGLHPVPAQRQDHQGRLRCGPPSRPTTPPRPRASTRPPSAPDSCCSSRGRFPSIRRRAQS